MVTNKVSRYPNIVPGPSSHRWTAWYVSIMYYCACNVKIACLHFK